MMAIVLAGRKGVLLEPSEILDPGEREVPNSLLSRKEWFPLRPA